MKTRLPAMKEHVTSHKERGGVVDYIIKFRKELYRRVYIFFQKVVYLGAEVGIGAGGEGNFGSL